MFTKDISPELTGRWEQTGEHTHKLVFCNQAYIELDDSVPDVPVAKLKHIYYKSTEFSTRLSMSPKPLDQLKKDAVRMITSILRKDGEAYIKLAISLETIKIDG